MGRRQVPPGLHATHARSQGPWVLMATLLTVGVAGLAPLASLASGGRIAVMDLMSDPAEVEQIPWYVGAVSDLNLFVWAAGAAVYLLAAVGMRRVDGTLAAALAWLGAVTVVLTLDDRFLLHEIVYPWLLGVAQLAAFVAYAVALAAVLARYRRVLLAQPELVLLLLGLVGLGTSVALDVLGWDSTVRRAAEESAKLLGAVAWSMFPAAIIVRHLTPEHPAA